MEEHNGQANGSEAARQAERLEATRVEQGRLASRVDAIEAVLTSEKPSRVVEWITVALGGLIALGGTVGWLINFVIEPLDRKIEEVKIQDAEGYAESKREREFIWEETREAREGIRPLQEKVLRFKDLAEERHKTVERDLEYLDQRIDSNHGVK